MTQPPEAILDEEQFKHLVTHYQRTLFNFLGGMGFSQAVAEDLAQETFLRAWHRRHTFDADKGRATTWLFRIARNLAYDEARKPYRQKTDFVDMDEIAISEDRQSTIEVQHRRELRHMVLTGLNELSLDDRCALALAYLHELTAPEAALVLGCSAGAFRTRLTRARQRLARVLEKLETQT